MFMAIAPFLKIYSKIERVTTSVLLKIFHLPSFQNNWPNIKPNRNKNCGRPSCQRNHVCILTVPETFIYKVVKVCVVIAIE